MTHLRADLSQAFVLSSASLSIYCAHRGPFLFVFFYHKCHGCNIPTCTHNSAGMLQKEPHSILFWTLNTQVGYVFIILDNMVNYVTLNYKIGNSTVWRYLCNPMTCVIKQPAMIVTHSWIVVISFNGQ